MAHTEPSSLASQCQNLPDSFRVSFFPKVTAFQPKGLIKSGLNSHQVMALLRYNNWEQISYLLHTLNLEIARILLSLICLIFQAAAKRLSIPTQVFLINS